MQSTAPSGIIITNGLHDDTVADNHPSSVLCMRIYVILSRTLASRGQLVLYLFEKRSTIAEALVSLEMYQRMRNIAGMVYRHYLLAPTHNVVIQQICSSVHQWLMYTWLASSVRQNIYVTPQNVLGGLIMGLNTKVIVCVCVCRLFENNKLY